jgi:hypothetical protein
MHTTALTKKETVNGEKRARRYGVANQQPQAGFKRNSWSMHYRRLHVWHIGTI